METARNTRGRFVACTRGWAAVSQPFYELHFKVASNVWIAVFLICARYLSSDRRQKSINRRPSSRTRYTGQVGGGGRRPWGLWGRT